VSDLKRRLKKACQIAAGGHVSNALLLGRFSDFWASFLVPVQKQNAVSPLSSGTGIALLVSFTLYPSGLGSTGGAVRPPRVWYAGRDLLLQVHVLHI